MLSNTLRSKIYLNLVIFEVFEVFGLVLLGNFEKSVFWQKISLGKPQK